jgi:hypothetical protein
MDYITQIIREEVERMLIDEKSHKKAKANYKTPDPERHTKAVRKLFLKYKNKGFSEKEAHNLAVKKYKEKLKKKREAEYRMRKKKGGGSERYNFTRYKEKNRDVAAGDYRQLADRIDQEKTDIAAVAREIFPHHTDEGAQSQLRKILNGERPMTDRVAQKLEDMISSGQIAVKG